jgi:hypothetical protein
MQVHDEAAGLMGLFIIWPEEVLPLLETALAGNALAISLLNPVLDTIRRIETAPPDLPMECGRCGRPLHGGAVLCAALPHRPDPKTSLAFALCRVCTSDAMAAEASAIEAMKNLWPEGRIIEVTHPQGGVA